jgi:Do/DeqQ family serine protease
MRKLSSILTAGLVGGLVAFGVVKLSINDSCTGHSTNQSPKTVLVSESVSSTPFDFVVASEKSTAAVVHIRAAESNELAQQRFQERKNNRRQNPFDMFDMEDFFGGGGFFGDGFQQNFYQPKSGTGSGVIMSEDGYIITNNHVVGFADEIIVTTNNNQEYKAEKIGADPASDLALLKIDGDDFPTLKFGDSDDVKVGEWVLAVGSPFGYLTSTVTAGIVSAKGRDLDLIKGEKTIEEFIQTDAAVNPGNSGGALVDQDGNLIGINTAIATPTGVFAGYSFAIPVNLVKQIINDIKENGNIERANLGIGGYDVTDVIKKDFGLTVDKGFYVVEVADGSGAQFAGLLPGDVIINANGKSVAVYDDLKNAIKFSKVGDRVPLKVIRDGKEKTITVKLKKQL